MKIDYDVGDVVVCVDDSGGLFDLPVVRFGQIERVSQIVECEGGGLGVELIGKTHPDWAYGAERFRKLPKADDTFTEQMRALRPHKVEEPA